VLNIFNFAKNGDTIILKKNEEIKIDIYSKKKYLPHYCSDLIIIDDSIRVESVNCESGRLVINKTGNSIKIHLLNCYFKNLNKRIKIKNEIIKAKLRPNNG